MSYNRHPAWTIIDGLPDWQQPSATRSRPGARADPGGRDHQADIRPYFVLDATSAPARGKDHVNVFLYDGAIVPTGRTSSPAATTTRRPDRRRPPRREDQRPRTHACSSRSSQHGRRLAEAEGLRLSSTGRPERLSAPSGRPDGNRVVMFRTASRRCLTPHRGCAVMRNTFQRCNEASRPARVREWTESSMKPGPVRRTFWSFSRLLTVAAVVGTAAPAVGTHVSTASTASDRDSRSRFRA